VFALVLPRLGKSGMEVSDTDAEVAAMAVVEAAADWAAVPIGPWLGVRDAVDAFEARFPKAVANPLVCDGPGLLSGVVTFVER
jgi:hypothetical protein